MEMNGKRTFGFDVPIVYRRKRRRIGKILKEKC